MVRWKMNHPYLELKLSWELFHKAPDTLGETEQRKLQGLALRQDQLERRILASPEAGKVVIPPATLQTRLQSVRERYESEDQFEQDLARSGLSPQTLEDAISRDLRVEAVLEAISSAVVLASETDAEIFYRLNPKAFDQPEIRTLRHILITWETPAEEQAALQCLNRLRQESTSEEAFAKAALRYSQCPTSLEGGVLGRVKRGQLYPELEPTAFSLIKGEISVPVASPIGLHIIRCDHIEPGGMLPFETVQERILERLNDQRRAEAQKAWIKQLPAGSP